MGFWTRVRLPSTPLMKYLKIQIRDFEVFSVAVQSRTNEEAKLAKLDEKQKLNKLEPEQLAEGFAFYSKKDAQLALAERKKIDYLESHIDYTKPETILQVYRMAIEEGIFKTPVGFGYLQKMQEYLLAQESISDEEIPPIALHLSFDSEVKNQSSKSKTKDKEDNKSILSVSIILNVALVIAMIAMFVISLNSEQPNIWNYERLLTDRYASWEQELTQREQTVREKELELHIEGSQ